MIKYTQISPNGAVCREYKSRLGSNTKVAGSVALRRSNPWSTERIGIAQPNETPRETLSNCPTTSAPKEAPAQRDASISHGIHRQIISLLRSGRCSVVLQTRVVGASERLIMAPGQKSKSAAGKGATKSKKPASAGKKAEDEREETLQAVVGS